MILKASQRGGGQDLAVHLMRMDDNEHVRLHGLRGFVADDLKGAFKEADAVSRGTKCRQYLFSLSLSPPAQERVPVDAFERAIDRIEDRLGLQGHAKVFESNRSLFTHDAKRPLAEGSPPRGARVLVYQTSRSSMESQALYAGSRAKRITMYQKDIGRIAGGAGTCAAIVTLNYTYPDSNQILPLALALGFAIAVGVAVAAMVDPSMVKDCAPGWFLNKGRTKPPQ